MADQGHIALEAIDQLGHFIQSRRAHNQHG